MSGDAGVTPAAVILAAGEGTRMRSDMPKVLHEVAGRPMVAHVVRAARDAGCERIVVVVGVGADAVRAALDGEGVEFVVQHERLGTGHALASAEGALRGFRGPIFCLNGDGPTVRAATLRAMAERHGTGEGMTMMTMRPADPTGLGRVVRDGGGAVRGIVEEKDATPEQRAIREVVPGVYLFDGSVWDRIGRLDSDNAQGEIYVTDLPSTYLGDGLPVRGFEAPDPSEGLAANDRVQLSVLERELRDRIRLAWMRSGVTMLSPETAFLDDDVDLGRDVVLEPFVVLSRGTTVGDGARIGAGAVLRGCRVAPGAVVPPHTVAVEAVLD